MKKRRGRVLVMLTEYVTMELPPRFMSDYIAAKYALLGLMKAAASEYGGKDLKINAIAPSMMDTSFLNGMDPKIKELEIYKNGRILSPADLFKDIDELLFGECEENGCIRVVRP
jgi:3-oxoacyl-[acyl-carrier protein] reductase